MEFSKFGFPKCCIIVRHFKIPRNSPQRDSQIPPIEPAGPPILLLQTFLQKGVVNSQVTDVHGLVNTCVEKSQLQFSVVIFDCTCYRAPSTNYLLSCKVV